MLEKLNDKIVDYSPEAEAYLVGLGFTPLSDRDRRYITETSPIMVLENGRLLSMCHWHMYNKEIFFVDGRLIYEGDEFKALTKSKNDEWDALINGFRGDVEDEVLDMLITKEDDE